MAAAELQHVKTLFGIFWGLTNYSIALDDFRLAQCVINVITYVGLWVTSTIVAVTGISLMLDVLRRVFFQAAKCFLFLR
jgi:hypothetical protein